MASAHPYARAYQSQSILTASPEQLVLLMYDGALRFMHQARAGFALPEDDLHRIEIINTSLLRAQAVITELRANLNLAAGGEVAANLERLYDYHLRRLTQSNLRKDEAPLIEVERLVHTLREAWAEMLRSAETRVA